MHGLKAAALALAFSLVTAAPSDSRHGRSKTPRHLSCADADCTRFEAGHHFTASRASTPPANTLPDSLEDLKCRNIKCPQGSRCMVDQKCHPVDKIPLNECKMDGTGLPDEDCPSGYTCFHYVGFLNDTYIGVFTKCDLGSSQTMARSEVPGSERDSQDDSEFQDCVYDDDCRDEHTCGLASFCSCHSQDFTYNNKDFDGCCKFQRVCIPCDNNVTVTSHEDKDGMDTSAMPGNTSLLSTWVPNNDSNSLIASPEIVARTSDQSHNPTQADEQLQGKLGTESETAKSFDFVSESHFDMVPSSVGCEEYDPREYRSRDVQLPEISNINMQCSRASPCPKGYDCHCTLDYFAEGVVNPGDIKATKYKSASISCTCWKPTDRWPAMKRELENQMAPRDPLPEVSNINMQCSKAKSCPKGSECHCTLDYFIDGIVTPGDLKAAKYRTASISCTCWKPSDRWPARKRENRHQSSPRDVLPEVSSVEMQCSKAKLCPKGTACHCVLQYFANGIVDPADIKTMNYKSGAVTCTCWKPTDGFPARRRDVFAPEAVPGQPQFATNQQRLFEHAPLTLTPVPLNGTNQEAPEVVPDHGGNPMVVTAVETSGSFQEAGRSGVPAMHAALMADGRVVFLDKMETDTEIQLADGRYAYSCLYDPHRNALTPLSVIDNAFCSGGTFLADGRVLSLGGSALAGFDPTIGNGYDAIRYLSTGQQDGWVEPGHKLSSNRWYPSAQMLADGSIFVASGSKTGMDLNDFDSNNPTYELLNRDGTPRGNSIWMELLHVNQPTHLYPFLHLLRSGDLFVFVAKSSQVLNVAENRVVKYLPDLHGLVRTYPVTGGSVLLPMSSKNGYLPEVMICGGGAGGGLDAPTDASCGRIQPDVDNPQWRMSTMPQGRTMIEGILLPDGTTLWLNGAKNGAQGWGTATNPAFDALRYDPEEDLFSNAGTSYIPRLYHSVAVLLLDGTVLVAGSNPSWGTVHPEQVNSAVPALAFPTEYRVEIYTPPYLTGDKASRRPSDVLLSTTNLRPDGMDFEVSFSIPKDAKDCKIVLHHGGFVTHSLHMGQRMVYLDHTGFEDGQEMQKLRAQMVSAAFGNKVVPPGPYVVYVVVDGIPSVGQSVMVA